MSIKAMNWAWQIDLAANKKLMLLCLADHADNDGVCWPGISAVVEKTGLSRRTVINFLHEFEAGGLLQRQQRKGQNGRQMASVIELNLKAERVHIGPSPGANPAPGEAGQPGAKNDDYRVQKTPLTGCKNAPVCNEEPTTESKTESSTNSAGHHQAPDFEQAEDQRLAAWMFGLILKLHPKHEPPNFVKWADTIRLMREVNKRQRSEIAALFRWANAHQFWCTNILSPQKLRQRWDQLCIQRAADGTASGAMVRMMTQAAPQADRTCSHLDGEGHRCGRNGVTSLGNHATSPWRCAEHAEVDIEAAA